MKIYCIPLNIFPIFINSFLCHTEMERMGFITKTSAIIKLNGIFRLK